MRLANGEAAPGASRGKLMDAVEPRDGEPERLRTEAARRAEARASKRAETLRANLKRRKSQIRARAEAQDALPEETSTARSPD